jgi:hypothetical protein
VGSQAVIDDSPVPIGYRDLAGVGEDPVPERLYVIEPLFDREVVKAGWGKGKSARHGQTSWRV